MEDDIPIAPSLYSLSNKMGNSLLAVRVINHKYIVVDMEKLERFRFSAFNPNVNFDEEIMGISLFKKESFYKKELCIVLLDENKNPISSCMGYFDVVNSDVEIENVCTKKEEEGKDFAKAVIAECIRRSLEMGVKHVNISGWNLATQHFIQALESVRRIEK